MSALPARSRSAPLGAALLASTALAVAGCTVAAPGGTADGAGGGAGPAAPPPPPPPAACLLDLDAMAGTTGLTWIPDATTASDTRCVYDPAPAGPSAAPTAPANGTGTGTGTGLDRAPAPTTGGDGASAEFVAVDIAAADERPVAAQLDVLAEVCDDGSRAPVGTGFVCRFDGDSVYAGLVRGEDVITVSASAVPAGTTAAALTMAIGQQVDALS